MKLFIPFVILLCISSVNAQGHPLVNAARSQIGVTTGYDGSYVKLAYPDGDISKHTGVCTDVVIRAMRKAHGMDLQQLIHKDMKRSFNSYPKIWGLSKPDSNIDHRRVPNIRTFFKRQGYGLSITTDADGYQPGDLVTSTLGSGRPHIMIVSNKKTRQGIPLVIHNIGFGTREEDMLFAFPITGHYRLKR